MANISNSIFKQYYGTLEEFKAYYNGLSEEQRIALSRALVFIHDKTVDDNWNNDGYIFANGKYYTCRETNLTASMLKDLLVSGDSSGMDIEEVDGKLVFTAVLKEDLKALTSVGFVENGKTWEKGTSLEQILNDIFAKEVWYTAAFSYDDNLVVSMTAPALTVTVDGAAAANSSTYEIGAPVVVSGSMSGSSATGNNFKITCSTPGNNGFVTNGATGTRLTELNVDAGLASSGSDSLSITAKGGAFKDMAVSSNNTLSGSSVVTSDTNNITLKSTSKTYTLTATPDASETTLTTLSNKNKYYDEETKDNISIKHTVGQTASSTKTHTSSISFTGKYKYYYAWGVQSLPTIPTSFSGDLEGSWTESWNSTTISNRTKKSLSGYIYVLKPVDSKPKIADGMGSDVSASFEKSSTTYTNKYGTTYYLYSFYDKGPTDYQTLVL